MSTAIQESAVTMESWRQSNQVYLELELERLRLLLHRRIFWLRSRWRHDPLAGFQTVISEEQADALLAGEDPAAEADFYRENADAVAISRRISDVSGDLETLRASWDDSSDLPALERLVHLFGLRDFERQTLVLCLAPELDPKFERLYAYVQDDVTRKYPTLDLALTLFAGIAMKEGAIEARWAERDRLSPDSPLRRYRLVELDSMAGSTATSGRSLQLDERMVDYLRGHTRLDQRLDGLFRPAPEALLAPTHLELVERLLLTQGGPPNKRRRPLNLLGPRKAGKRAVARALCDRMGVPLFQLDVRRLPDQPQERRELLQLMEREMLLLQAALYLDGVGLAADSSTHGAMHSLLDQLGSFFILGSEDPWPTERQLAAVEVRKPDAKTRRELWQRVFASERYQLNGQAEALVEQFDFGPAAMARALTHAQNLSLIEATDNGTPVSRLAPKTLWRACRLIARKELDSLAHRIVSPSGWQDIVLPDETLDHLKEIASQVAQRYQVYETWGFGTKLSRGRGVNVLFAGPSGTGKTMAAEVLANHLDLDLYRIDLAGMISKYIGETEKNLRKIFDAAEESGAVLFFDEADALFGKRTEVKDSHDRYANIEVNYLLQRMEEYRGLAILATNRKTALDRAFLRRLRFLVDFVPPDAERRRQIWEKMFPSAAEMDELELDELARLEIPGGNIKNIAVNAAFLAAGDGDPIGLDHIMQAARREYLKIDKLITSAEFAQYYEVPKR